MAGRCLTPTPYYATKQQGKQPAKPFFRLADILRSKYMSYSTTSQLRVHSERNVQLHEARGKDLEDYEHTINHEQVCVPL